MTPKNSALAETLFRYGRVTLNTENFFCLMQESSFQGRGTYLQFLVSVRLMSDELFCPLMDIADLDKGSDDHDDWSLIPGIYK